MIFVHSRKDTVKTAQMMRDIAKDRNQLSLFDIKDDPQFGLMKKEVDKSRNKELKVK